MFGSKATAYAPKASPDAIFCRAFDTIGISDACHLDRDNDPCLIQVWIIMKVLKVLFFLLLKNVIGIGGCIS